VSDAGTPLVSDPGEHLVGLAHESGIRVEPVPGPSALAAALSASGMGTEGFVFLGFPPTKGTARRAWFDRLYKAREVVSTAIFYEAPHRVTVTLSDLKDKVGDVQVCVCRELTKAHEEVRCGPISQMALASDKGEFTVVVDLGETTKVAAAEGPDTERVAHEFGELTKSAAMSRRQAIASLSRKHGISAREIYAMLEAAKKSVV
jgi:16S rRNA (cytidine1402-2'-O)-methyltransferase